MLPHAGKRGKGTAAQLQKPYAQLVTFCGRILLQVSLRSQGGDQPFGGCLIQTCALDSV